MSIKKISCALAQKHKGLTLIEMMVALVLGLFVTAVIITVFSTNVRSNTENLKMIRLNQELRGVMNLMSDEFKRSGYSGYIDGVTTSAFMNQLDRVSSDCVLYAFDTNSDGDLDVNERRGFRLNSNQIDWKTSGTGTDCSSTNNDWEAITSSEIASITTLEFDFTGSVNSDGTTGLTALSASSGLSVYEVEITLTGSTDLPHSSAANDPRRTVIETIRIRNDAPKD
jgi:prepilin-type N-terminal cleavage/methylation domain-containing protein